MKIAILTNGPRAWAGSRLRGYWLEDADPIHFKVYAPGDRLNGIDACDAVVFQKLQDPLNIERARRFKAEGKVVLYDLCDPVWWWYPNETKDMMRAADAVITSNDALSEVVRDIGIAKRVVTIIDRMLPSFHPTVRQHEDRERLVFVWYGASQNRIALEGSLPLLGYLAHSIPLELRIIDDAPGAKVIQQEMGHLRIVNVPFALETYDAQLTDCDVAWLPPYPGVWGELKSNNRQATAWWCGLPVVDGQDLGEMRDLCESAEVRQMVAVGNRKIAEAHYDIHQSVREVMTLVRECKGEIVYHDPFSEAQSTYKIDWDNPLAKLVRDDHIHDGDPCTHCTERSKATDKAIEGQNGNV
jgi:hypothetical protein